MSSRNRDPRTRGRRTSEKKNNHIHTPSNDSYQEPGTRYTPEKQIGYDKHNSYDYTPQEQLSVAQGGEPTTDIEEQNHSEYSVQITIGVGSAQATNGAADGGTYTYQGYYQPSTGPLTPYALSDGMAAMNLDYGPQPNYSASTLSVYHTQSSYFPSPATSDYPKHETSTLPQYLESSPSTDNRKKKSYSAVKVLLVHWKEDGDLPGCSGEVYDLEKIFKNKFVFQTKIVAIRDVDTEQAKSHIRNFFSEARGSELLILYYGGHATKYPFSLCSATPNRTKIDWEPIRRDMEYARSDVLWLPDCCYAMASVAEKPYGRTHMAIGAAEDYQVASPPGPYSFTFWLQKALKQATNNFTCGTWASDIQAKIAHSMSCSPDPKLAKVQESQIQTFAGTTGDIWLERFRGHSRRRRMARGVGKKRDACDKGLEFGNQLDMVDHVGGQKKTQIEATA